jgi:hypothetical protein
MDFRLLQKALPVRVTENKVEERLTRGVKELGGECLKWVSPGRVGVPDRIVLMPGGRITFVELKAPQGKLSAAQARTLGMLLDMGCRTAVVSTPEQVDEFLCSL